MSQPLRLRHACVLLLASLTALAAAQTPTVACPPGPFDLLLQHGHVFDPKNAIDATMDVAIKDKHIACVAPAIDPAGTRKIVDARGLWITPGLIDLHTHVYAGTGEKNSLAGDESVYPDGFTFRAGVTTAVDAGGSGWRNFEDFKQRIIDRSKTRVLADLNIVGAGMRGPAFEQNLTDMDGAATAAMAKKYPGVIVGIKVAHFAGPEWTPFEQAEEAGRLANLPVMVDYGARRIERPLTTLMAEKLRPGDIYTHCFSGLRGEQDQRTGGPSKAMLIARQRGIFCDVGHGSGSFSWSVAIPMVRAGYLPDSISTDLHFESMNLGMKNILNIADKFLLMGETLPQVFTQMTWNPAREIRQTQLGNLSPGASADLAVFSVDHGHFGFIDTNNIVVPGTQKLVCELTVRDGAVVWDLNGLAARPYVPPTFPR